MTGTGAGFNPVSLPWVPQAGGNPGIPQNNPNYQGMTPNQSAGDIARNFQGSNNPDWLNSLIERAKTDTGAYEKLIDYYATRESEKTAREWTAQREDTAYQRLMDDLKKAGISPYVLSGATPSVSSSVGKSYSGSQMTSRENNAKTVGSSELKSLLALLGVMLYAGVHLI